MRRSEWRGKTTPWMNGSGPIHNWLLTRFFRSSKKISNDHNGSALYSSDSQWGKNVPFFARRQKAASFEIINRRFEVSHVIVIHKRSLRSRLTIKLISLRPDSDRPGLYIRRGICSWRFFSFQFELRFEGGFTSFGGLCSCFANRQES